MNNLDVQTDRLTSIGITLAIIGAVAAIALVFFPDLTTSVLNGAKQFVMNKIPK